MLELLISLNIHLQIYFDFLIKPEKLSKKTTTQIATTFEGDRPIAFSPDVHYIGGLTYSNEFHI